MTDRPEFVEPGDWQWKSFLDTHSPGYRTTALRVPIGSRYQHILVLDWSNFSSENNDGRADAESLAQYICDAINLQGAH